MPQRTPRNPSNDAVTQEQLEERQVVAETKVQLVQLVDECIRRAVRRSNEPAYGTKHHTPTCAEKQALPRLYPVGLFRFAIMGSNRKGDVLDIALSLTSLQVQLLENPYTIASLYDPFPNQRHGEPTLAPVKIPAHITPEDIIETIEGYARSCLCGLLSSSLSTAWEAALEEWTLYTRYTVCDYEPDLDSKQRAQYLRALFSFLDNLYKEEDQTWVPTYHSLSPGVDFLFPILYVAETPGPQAPESARVQASLRTSRSLPELIALPPALPPTGLFRVSAPNNLRYLQERVKLFNVIERCARKAEDLTNQRAYAQGWLAITGHVISTRFTDLASLDWARPHFKHLLEDLNHHSGTYAVKDRPDAHYPLCLTTGKHVKDELSYSARRETENGTHPPRNTTLTPVQLLIGIQSFARSRLHNLRLSQSYKSAFEEWQEDSAWAHVAQYLLFHSPRPQAAGIDYLLVR
ncbi:hypothetical protein C6P46_002066 [Rhodotorula mucilaginosa]|uniref:Uncharacterized protein n=1 Tax=Rhodotorula mucilaginosa TaxID=5537 RepID=A0A9P6VU49_RHOMI|nr:hypothetical protein C6P46_002066 [Rhodotorula mucilaginosa]